MWTWINPETWTPDQKILAAKGVVLLAGIVAQALMLAADKGQTVRALPQEKAPQGFFDNLALGYRETRNGPPW